MLSNVNRTNLKKYIFCQAVTNYTEKYPEEGKSQTLYLNVLCGCNRM